MPFDSTLAVVRLAIVIPSPINRMTFLTRRGPLLYTSQLTCKRSCSDRATISYLPALASCTSLKRIELPLPFSLAMNSGLLPMDLLIGTPFSSITAASGLITVLNSILISNLDPAKMAAWSIG